MLVRAEAIPHGVILHIEVPRVDMSISRRFREEIQEILAPKPNVVIMDFEKTDYLDSSALGSLVSILRDVRGYGGDLRLIHLNQTLRMLLKLSKLDALFKIYDKLEDAMK
ncbi:MAG: STAS domain-containing protein [Leptospiraceae bacterium]|nr:STAS domain-containing protein [Leptospiraceae bacterium]MDW8306921.1 STAS domain-containing protein [Leptospiraceae bacterium]